MSILLDIHPKETSGETANPARTTRLLLKLLRACQPISRIDLARRLNVNRSTVTDIFKPLIAAGIIREEPFQTAENNRAQGRPPIALSFNDARDYFVGLNLGVRSTQVGLTTLSGEILAEEEFQTPPDSAQALARARKTIEELCAKIKDRRLRVIGVACPGMIDAARRNLIFAPHLDWHNIPVADKLQFVDELKGGKKDFVPVIVENDATAAALYEARIKIGESENRLLNNFILVRSGTGIGVGIVLESEVYRGTGVGTGLAGEFGHMTIMAGGKSCVCGNRGCWEKYASASSAASLYAGERAQFGNEKTLRFVEIVARAAGGEVRARRTLERIGEYLGIGIGNVIMGIGIPHVIVSGRLVYGWNFIKEPLLEAIGKSMVGKLTSWTVEAGEPKGAAIGGALEVAVEEFLMHGLTS